MEPFPFNWTLDVMIPLACGVVPTAAIIIMVNVIRIKHLMERDD